MKPAIAQHTPIENLQALLIGTLLVALAVSMFKQAGLLSGGTAGLAFLAHYLGGMPFSVAFFVFNLPFYWLAWKFMGATFTFRTFVAVLLFSVEADLLPRCLSFATLDPTLAAILGGVLLGNGFLILFRHKASLGGVGILALVLQGQRCHEIDVNPVVHVRALHEAERSVVARSADPEFARFQDVLHGCRRRRPGRACRRLRRQRKSMKCHQHTGNCELPFHSASPL
ncbi:YitT family protein [Cupriavidus sp. YR651]|uniref:YitT family protein n=1 Tax=Cupriavidus sp. YR651 TaxID=1855315 RepID=UPI000ACCBCC9|nr:YitT family protein [Cupriavidus sp. YR651]